MVKKKTNGQSIVIIILSILLLISIGFGVTYSYYNGKSNLVTGNIMTATLSISLNGVDSNGETTKFSISAPGEQLLVPGNSLNNVALNLSNDCTQRTYMVVLYSLSAHIIKKTEDEKPQYIPNDLLKDIPAITFKEDAFETDVWHSIIYKCANVENTSYACLVGINPFKGKESSTSPSLPINVLNKNSLKIPHEWNDDLQNCEVTISVIAYAIQAENLEAKYREPILKAEADNKIEDKAQAIAKAVLEINKIDYSAPVSNS